MVLRGLRPICEESCSNWMEFGVSNGTESWKDCRGSSLSVKPFVAVVVVVVVAVVVVMVKQSMLSPIGTAGWCEPLPRKVSGQPSRTPSLFDVRLAIIFLLRRRVSPQHPVQLFVI